MRHLRRAAVPNQDGSHLLLLSSLRQLRDPALRSFFYQLSQRGDPASRIHAILGLAEIDENHRINPWLITQLDSADARYAAIGNALEMDLVATEQIHELLGWDDLEARSRILLLSELLLRGEKPDAAALARLTGNPSLDVAGLAACIRLQLGDDGAMSAYKARLDGASPEDRARNLQEVFLDVDRCRLTAVLDWVAEMVQAPGADPEVVKSGITAVLAVDPKRGAELWQQALGPDPSYSKCVRFSLLLLGGGSAVPAAAYDALPRGDELIDRMVVAGKAVSTGDNPSEAINSLLDLGHLNSARWAMAAVKDLDDEQASRIYLHVIDRVEGETRGRDERAQLGIIATSRLFKLDPALAVKRLEQAEDDSLTQRTMLLGLLESPSPAAGEAARRIPRVGFGEADLLALILIAKHAASLEDHDLRALGVVAAGGGLVSPVLQAQAAWLYLRHTAQVERALSATFADDRTNDRP